MCSCLKCWSRSSTSTSASFTDSTNSVEYVSPRRSRFDPKWYIWVFITCDILALILQAVGGGLSASSNGGDDTGVQVALAGLSIQVITLVFFIALVVDFLVRSRTDLRQREFSTRFKIFCGALALATILILIRCSYRIYELSEGYSQDSEALRDENLFIGLESVLVVLLSDQMGHANRCSVPSSSLPTAS